MKAIGFLMQWMYRIYCFGQLYCQTRVKYYKQKNLHIQNVPLIPSRTSLALILLPIIKLLHNFRVKNNFDIRNKQGK